MEIYLLVYAILILACVLQGLFPNKWLLYGVGLGLAIFAGLRYQMGYDYDSYSRIFEGVTSFQDVINSKVDAEIGFRAWIYLAKSLGLNYQAFVLANACLSMTLLLIFLSRTSQYGTYLLLYYFVRYFMARDMGQVRGGLAALILLFGVLAIQKRKPWQFVCACLLASTFHVTSLIFLPAYPAYWRLQPFTPRKVMTFTGLALICGFFVQTPTLYAWMIPGRYLSYFVSPAYANGKWLLNPILWMEILILFGSLLILRKRKMGGDQVLSSSLVIFLYGVGICILLAAGRLGTIGGRLSGLFSTLEMVLVPSLLLNLTENKFFNHLVYFLFTMVIFILIFVISGMMHVYIPYQTIFTF